MRWMLFAHIMGVAFWLGGTATLYVLYRKAMRLISSGSTGELTVAHDTTRSVIRGILNPCALLVLFTGIGMLMQLGLVRGPKPFWLLFMEQFGGMVALVSVGILTWQMRRLDRASAPEEQARHWHRLNRMIVGVGAGIAVTVFVVMLKF